MKIRLIPSIISLLAAALLGYLFFTIAGGTGDVATTVAITGSVCTFLTLLLGIGVSWGDSRHSTNAFAISSFFTLVFIAAQCMFAAWCHTPSIIIISSGLALLAYLLIVYGISKAKM